MTYSRCRTRFATCCAYHQLLGLLAPAVVPALATVLAVPLLSGCQANHDAEPATLTERQSPPSTQPPQGQPAQPQPVTASAPANLAQIKQLWEQGADAKHRGDYQGARQAWQKALALDTTRRGFQEAIDNLPKTQNARVQPQGLKIEECFTFALGLELPGGNLESSSLTYHLAVRFNEPVKRLDRKALQVLSPSGQRIDEADLTPELFTKESLKLLAPPSRSVSPKRKNEVDYWLDFYLKGKSKITRNFTVRYKGQSIDLPPAIER